MIQAKDYTSSASTHPSVPLNSLTGGSDYSGESFSVTFPAGVNVMSFNVPIINDNIAELAESFSLTLEIPAESMACGVIAGSPDTATVNIVDDEGKLSTFLCGIITLCPAHRSGKYSISVVAISFSPQNYTVPEGTPANLVIVLDTPSSQDITVTVTTMDITAEGNFVLNSFICHYSMLSLRHIKLQESTVSIPPRS